VKINGEATNRVKTENELMYVVHFRT